MFIIPDECLEKTLCGICNKFLSVEPVKISPDGYIKCGRCQRPEDGENSVDFGLFGMQGLFKCVNRFDGCRELMKPHQVAEHESTCHGMKINCPLCPNNKFIPTYMLIKHFGELHPDNYLQIPTFRVEMKRPLTNVYLYRLQDNLFFIEAKFPAPFSIELNTHYLGDKTQCDPRLKFAVYFGDYPMFQEVESASRPGKYITKYHKNVFESPSKQEAQFAFVEFQVCSRKREPTPVEKSMPYPPKFTAAIPRKLDVNVDVDESLKIGSTETSIILRNSTSMREFFMFCFNCKTVDDGENPEFIKVDEGAYYVVCRQCYQYAKSSLELDISPAWELYLGFIQFRFEFSCIWQPWGCSKYHAPNEIANHESNCSRQPKQKCPVFGCIFSGKLFDMEKHFLNNHPYDNVFFIKEDVEIEEPPRSVATNNYIWAFHGFVPIKIGPSEKKGHYEVSFVHYDKKEFVGKPSPKILVVSINKRLSFVIKDNTSLCFENGERIHISCYFSIPEQDGVLPVAS